MVLHPTYLPFSAAHLREHFSPVRGSGALDGDRHLKYYLDSLAAGAAYADRVRAGHAVTPAETRRGRQMEKDERFWVAAALMTLYHAEPRHERADRFAELLRLAGLAPLPGFDSWECALAGDLRLYFEVNLPSPPSYRHWLRDHLNERIPVPYVREAAASAGTRVEGATKVDAMLINADNGVAVAFEAKVLSDTSTSITFDVLRNQIARIVDVLLDGNPSLLAPLNDRRPERSCLVLLTPEIFRDSGETDFNGGRLYAWLMRAYRDPVDPLLQRHLPHRRDDELASIAHRLGWATWEDCNVVVPTACPWLPEPSRR